MWLKSPEIFSLLITTSTYITRWFKIFSCSISSGIYCSISFFYFFAIETFEDFVFKTEDLFVDLFEESFLLTEAFSFSSTLSSSIICSKFFFAVLFSFCNSKFSSIIFVSVYLFSLSRYLFKIYFKFEFVEKNEGIGSNIKRSLFGSRKSH